MTGTRRTTPLSPKAAALAAALAVALGACAGDKVWMRSGSGSTDVEIDEMSCAEQAEGGPSVTVGAGTSLPTDRFSNRYACLRSRGYKLTPLTAEESQKLKSLGGDAREDFWRELLQKHGFRPPDRPGAPPAPVLPAAPPPR